MEGDFVTTGESSSCNDSQRDHIQEQPCRHCENSKFPNDKQQEHYGTLQGRLHSFASDMKSALTVVKTNVHLCLMGRVFKQQNNALCGHIDLS